jgi:hypothetical protein
MTSRNLLLKNLENGIERFGKRLIKLEAESKKFGLFRLFTFFGGVIFFFISFFFLSEEAVWGTIILFALLFGIITGILNKIEYGIKKNKIWLKIKKTHIARIKIDWKNIPVRYSAQDPSHPFDADLNITGDYSLHQLLDVSASKGGSDRLKDWLLSLAPDKELILKRQKLIKELIPLQRFRDKLILFSNLTSKKELSGNKLSEGLIPKGNSKKLKKILIFLSILIPVNVLLILLSIFGILPSYWSITSLLYLSIYFFNSNEIKDLFEQSMEVEDELGKFSVVLEFLESCHYGRNKNLKEFCSIFTGKENSPSKYFKKLKRITLGVSLQKNPLTRLILNAAFPYDFYFALKLEKIKEKISALLPGWLDTYYELEAHVSLANYASLNPDYNFPEIKNISEKISSVLDAVRIGHPLIPFEQNIKNDFTINMTGDIGIVTGSNMSGKSTFLKTIGTNFVLASAGSVVNAEKFGVIIFKLFTCIKITDSVTDGISYFYAEVKRLKQLLTEIKNEKKYPIFFLIDEIFRGTNNLERLIGSRSYIKAAAKLKGTGLVSTHDLELVKLEEEISNVLNYHFKEDVAEGRMIFDYKIRRGPSPTTNALKIMEIEGLPVEKR